MRIVTTSEARKNLSAVIRQVRRGDRILLNRHDKPCAAIVSVADLCLLQRLTDQEDVSAARKAMAEEERISFDDLRAELGL